jgi:putative membrane protein insertion efficiency factor
VRIILNLLVKFYRLVISPFFPPCCRYIPTCSQYSVEAISKYGALKGVWFSINRLCCCHPFSKREMFDPVPDRK